MLKSMMSAVTGLRSQQTEMDIIGNNIANVNTAGFKSSRATFKDMFYQTLNQGSSAINPSQVGFGSQVSSVDKIMTRMGATQTDKPLDLYIDGEGFFVTNSQPDGSGDSTYTRVGNFHIDANGNLADSNGNYIVGVNETAAGPTFGQPINLESTNYIVSLVTPSGTSITVNNAAPISATNVHYDSLSNISVNSDGTLSANVGSSVGTLNCNVGAGAPNPIKIALATFVNPDGLTEIGNNNYTSNISSGNAACTEGGNGNATVIRSGALEMSNVDLANEFTNMIITERGYQSNARVITTSDNMIQELVNLVK